MKIGFAGFDLPEGKVKFQDEKVINLENKFAPQKTTPFYAEFIKNDFLNCDAIFISQKSILDLLILDMEKLETRRDRTRMTGKKAAGQVPELPGTRKALMPGGVQCRGDGPAAGTGPLESKAHGGGRSAAGSERRHQGRAGCREYRLFLHSWEKGSACLADA